MPGLCRPHPLQRGASSEPGGEGRRDAPSLHLVPSSRRAAHALQKQQFHFWDQPHADGFSLPHYLPSQGVWVRSVVSLPTAGRRSSPGCKPSLGAHSSSPFPWKSMGNPLAKSTQVQRFMNQGLFWALLGWPRLRLPRSSFCPGSGSSGTPEGQAQRAMSAEILQMKCQTPKVSSCGPSLPWPSPATPWQCSHQPGGGKFHREPAETEATPVRSPSSRSLPRNKLLSSTCPRERPLLETPRNLPQSFIAIAVQT